jgi:hypothetical protein
MLKLATAGLTALFVTASPLAYAQAPSAATQPRAFNAAELSSLTDMRIDLVKAALQLTPDQLRYWPAIEDAIRTRAKDRQARIASAERTVGEARSNPLEALRDRNPVEFMRQRAEAWEQRATDLKKLADAWQPLYQTLTPEQKKRMGQLAVLVIRDTRDTLERRRLDTD